MFKTFNYTYFQDLGTYRGMNSYLDLQLCCHFFHYITAKCSFCFLELTIVFRTICVNGIITKFRKKSN